MVSKGRFVNLTTLGDIQDTINIVEINGPAPGTFSCAQRGLRYCTSDTAIPGPRYPSTIPPEGSKALRSYFKTTFVEVVDFGTLCEIIGREIGEKVHRIGRLSVFCDESIFGSCNLFADRWMLSKSGDGGVIVGQRDDGENGMPIECYVQATGVKGVTGDPLENHPYFWHQDTPIRKLDCFTFNRPCLIDKSVHDAEFTSKAMVTQMVIPPTASHGEKPAIGIMYGVEVS